MIDGAVHGLLKFAFFYPLAMSLLWMSGAIIYFLRWERGAPARAKPQALASYPMVSLIVPCHNEGEHVRETIAHLAEQSWPDFEIIAVNDGSTDDTGQQLDQLMNEYPNLRVLHLSGNQGKAMGLRAATLAAKSEYLVCVDGDALLDRYATHWMMVHLMSSARVGAVTGNPRIRNRSTLLGKLQVGEFSCVIGLIKRAQRVYGRIFTVSGVITAFRKVALHDVGYWKTDMVTDDIDVSWRLQMRHWEIRFEPNALCWILMPETFKGLWRQRLRWAQGGSEVLLRYWPKLLHWRQRRMWVVALEYVTSLAWSYVMVATVLLWLLQGFFPLPPAMRVPTLLPQWNGVLLGLVCMLQFLVSLLIDRRYEKRVGRYYYWMIWYPIAFWMLTIATSVVALPKAMFKRRGTRARWTSPDRGVR
ncbi:poly-beta-1,6-N-acetyl-D-glucosamine synthase [Dyella mobilis]|uniref:Poly-beta-1,6-N-acetyl-D-glucosamine synthase n=1 Tax=Dyella mobilis TaxID=1849582 RepID=A0ABS2KIA0_9GAMM|nr:poly-beta-1,6-N-acetyl-D-glucosamine synthase [Dyella mobilis]MBM7130775.1 poly-beta-1,6 N-acetyl-D-glucosamine synthase [Dyella mobilis]GLQ97401.1 poly-beta-1,6 N-acetyl-D-glucosamine synthase [Dyella mobilis]